MCNIWKEINVLWTQLCIQCYQKYIKYVSHQSSSASPGEWTELTKKLKTRQTNKQTLQAKNQESVFQLRRLFFCRSEEGSGHVYLLSASWVIPIHN